MRDGALVAVGRPSDLKQRVDQKLRLELLFPPARPPCLPPGLTCHQLEPGRWLVLLEREEVTKALNGLDLEQIDDFRLQSATLEDLYVHYATQP
jgi:ABC-2 type transport system ATP-binding protein